MKPNKRARGKGEMPLRFHVVRLWLALPQHERSQKVRADDVSRRIEGISGLLNAAGMSYTKMHDW